MNTSICNSYSHTLYYVHDPMCSWCWGFQRTWQEVETALAGKVKIQYVLGGLAADSDQTMSEAMQIKLQDIWHTIQRQIPGTRFNFKFWSNCLPRRSTYPACRAVIAAKQQGAERAMIKAIQHAYYLHAENPSDLITLDQLAEDIELDRQRFSDDLRSEHIQSILIDDIALAQSLGAQGFPSLILKNESGYRLLALDYNSAERILEQIL